MTFIDYGRSIFDSFQGQFGVNTSAGRSAHDDMMINDPFNYFSPPPQTSHQDQQGFFGFDFFQIFAVILLLFQLLRRDNNTNDNTTDPPPGDSTPQPQQPEGQTIDNTTSNTTVDGGDGNDTITSTADNVTVHGLRGSDAINLNAGRDNTVYGDSGDDIITISGSQHNTRIYGGSGDDVIRVNEHRDNPQSNDNQHITISGGSGTDTVELEGAEADFDVEIQENGDRVYTRKRKSRDENEKVQTVTIKADVENIHFTDVSPRGETVEITHDPTDKPNNVHEVSTGEGDDTVRIHDGENVVTTTNGGDDTVELNRSGAQDVDTGAGNDTVDVNGSAAIVNTGDGDDVIHADAMVVNDTTILSNVTLNAGSGNDTLNLSQNQPFGVYSAQADLGEGDDTVNVGLVRSATLGGGAGNDEFVIDTGYAAGQGDGIIHISGGDGDNDRAIIQGRAQDFEVEKDLANGYWQLRHRESGKVIRIDDDVEHLEFALPNTSPQHIKNNISDTMVSTGPGNDTVENSGSNNSISTGEGNDVVENSGSHTQITTGTGADDVTSNGTGNTIDTGIGADSVNLQGNYNTVNTGNDDDVVVVTGSAWDNTINTGLGNDHISVGNPDDNSPYAHSVRVTQVNAGVGDDIIHIYHSGETAVNGGVGNDHIYYHNANSRDTTVEGGAGMDTLHIAGHEQDYEVSEEAGTGRTVLTHKESGQRLVIGNDIEQLVWMDGSNAP